jgi:glycine dehydrogenase
MDLSNASLLDEATAAAEAMTMLYGARKGPKKKSRLLFD